MLYSSSSKPLRRYWIMILRLWYRIQVPRQARCCRWGSSFISKLCSAASTFSACGEDQPEGSQTVILEIDLAALMRPLLTSVIANHLILQRGKLFKDVAEFIPLSGAIVPVDLDQAAEWLQGERTTPKHTLSPLNCALLGAITALSSAA